MRQYMRAKRDREKRFSYRDIKKVFVIVLYENSTAAFRQCPGTYLHYGKTTFDTGLKLDLLQEFCLVALDAYRKIPYPKREKSEQQAWLSFLTTEDLKDAETLVKDYPWLEEIYREIAVLRRRPETGGGARDVVRRPENTGRKHNEAVCGRAGEKLQNALETNKLEKARGQEMLRQITEEKEADIRRITAEKDAQIAALEKKLKELSGN